MSLLSPASPAAVGSRDDEEESLIRRAAAMDAAAWDALFEAHFEAIYRYAFLRLGDPAASEDVASEVFLQAVRSISRYRHRGIASRAWLYRIAHNVVADARRAGVRRASASLAPLTNGPDFAPAVLARKDLNEALACLTDDQQQVIILRFIEDLSIAETAQAMARPAGAVKALQHRALNRMRRILEGAD